jgi:CDP-diacylglycerol--glycerol-3-phosphate 3-phosphatidyltransferase
MNLPNKLTLGRLVLTIGFLGVFFSGLPFANSMAMVLFVVASVTDLFDGRIARRQGLITNFGILMDPLVDKIMVCSAFIAFVGRGFMPAWMAALIVARELAITGLRLLAASKQVVLAAEGYGKHKTVSQMVAIVAMLIMASHGEWGSWAVKVFERPVLGNPWVEWFTQAALWAAVFFTVVSGAIYLQRNRHLYLDDI